MDIELSTNLYPVDKLFYVVDNFDLFDNFIHVSYHLPLMLKCTNQSEIDSENTLTTYTSSCKVATTKPSIFTVEC